MARLVAIHGIGNQYSIPEDMRRTWWEPLRAGVEFAGGAGTLEPGDVGWAFYRDLFRPRERVLSDDIPPYRAGDVDDGFETDLLMAWWAQAAAVDPAVVPPDARTLSAASRVQDALSALLCSPLVAGASERVLIFRLKQVHRYFTEPALRDAVRTRVADAIDADTQVVVAHSLGTVVAYEVLCARPDLAVTTLVTLGSPLGIPNLIHHRLQPPARWPGQVVRWTNLVDDNDFIALVKKIGPLFDTADRAITDLAIDNGWRLHSVERYLCAEATGRAILTGLTAAR